MSKHLSITKKRDISAHWDSLEMLCWLYVYSYIRGCINHQLKMSRARDDTNGRLTYPPGYSPHQVQHTLTVCSCYHTHENSYLTDGKYITLRIRITQLTSRFKKKCFTRWLLRRYILPTFLGAISRATEPNVGLFVRI